MTACLSVRLSAKLTLQSAPSYFPFNLTFLDLRFVRSICSAMLRGEDSEEGSGRGDGQCGGREARPYYSKTSLPVLSCTTGHGMALGRFGKVGERDGAWMVPDGDL